MNKELAKLMADPLFDLVDTDKSGYIEKNEVYPKIKELVEKKGKAITDAEIDELYDQVDKSKDGKISRDEFVDLVALVLEKVEKAICS